ncbi:MAG: 3-deoxy-D-manno-octulosonic acid transferase, partial [Alistipes sp.]|nr:3-deoxy-D-manno-octulosonic acid transferase [Alistipes sp.]
MLIYNICIALYARLVGLVGLWNKKARQWAEGRKGIFFKMQQCIKPTDKIVWIHVASLGEFEQGRPIIEQIRKQGLDYKILVTFFSPSGYEIRKNYNGADYIFYLPADTPRNVKRFLDIVNPEIAIFVKYEFWLNYLRELKRRKVRTFVISAIFRKNSIFFKWYGAKWRQALESFEQMFVQNEESKALLRGIGFENVVVAGDTRFDRVAELAQAVKPIEMIERF